MIDLKQIEVWMHGQKVGVLALTPNRVQTVAFEYSKEWLHSGFSISPLELPLTPELKVAQYHPFDGNFGVFADSLPDGWGQLILHRYLATKGINSKNLSILQQLCLVGQTGRGALEYLPAENIRHSAAYLDFERLAAETESILGNDDFVGEHLEELIERGGSPGGARPKIFVKQEDGEWLVKFRSKTDKKNIGQIEYQYSLLAKQCGIEMPDTKLFDGKWFGVKRFDRVGENRVHTISAAGLLRADYRLPCMDYSHLFQLSARLSHSMEELWRIYRLMCFNVLIGNRDDHAKNFSFIYDNGWRLSPAYDLLPCGTENDFHTTSVNDNPKPTKQDILSLAKKVGLHLPKAEQIYDEMEMIVKENI